MSLGVSRSGSQSPLPQTVPAHHHPRWAGEGGREGLSPSSVHRKRPNVCKSARRRGAEPLPPPHRPPS